MTLSQNSELYFVYMLFLNEGLMHIEVHVLHIIMSKKLENYHDWSGYRRFSEDCVKHFLNSYWSG